MSGLRLLLAGLLAARLVASEAAPPRDLEAEAELVELVAWMQSEGGWFTIRHPDPLSAARSEPLERIRNDLDRVLRSNEHLLPARKPILLATVFDPSLADDVRFPLAVFLTNFHTTLRLDRDERLRVEGIIHRLRAYDYSRAIALLTMTILREFRGQPAAVVGPALRTLGWTVDDDEVRYVIGTVIPTMKVD